MASSSLNFRLILDAALDDYVKQTGVDLTKHPLSDELQRCGSPEEVLRLLQKREKAFKDYRDESRLINCLGPVVQVVHAFSSTLCQGTSLVCSFCVI